MLSSRGCWTISLKFPLKCDWVISFTAKDLSSEVGLQENILRLRELVNIISRQQVVAPEQTLRALIS